MTDRLEGAETHTLMGRCSSQAKYGPSPGGSGGGTLSPFIMEGEKWELSYTPVGNTKRSDFQGKTNSPEDEQ